MKKNFTQPRLMTVELSSDESVMNLVFLSVEPTADNVAADRAVNGEYIIWKGKK